MTIFNSAPVSSEIPREVYQLTDIFCPNESEAELLTGLPVHTLDDARLAAAVILERGAKAALITLGTRGCLYVTATEDEHIPVQAVTAVDTTGAGDAFVGSLAYCLASGCSMRDAITRANLQREMQELHRRLHVTVLFVTHDVDEALRLADTVALFQALGGGWWNREDVIVVLEGGPPAH